MSSSEPSLASDALSAQLLPEALGFEPQFLLDDLFNVAQSAALAAADAMAGYLARWPRARPGDAEQGAVALQTLLDSRVDGELDFFEMWARRNVFVLPEDAPLVMPHHAGLDLNVRENAEAELLAEIEELRRQKENMHKLRALYTRAVDASAQHRALAEAQLAELSFLPPALPADAPLSAAPAHIAALRAALAGMPPADTLAPAAPPPAYDARAWVARRGYDSWALARALGAPPVPAVEREGVVGLLAAEGVEMVVEEEAPSMDVS